jgi:hypothetical protein
MENNMKLKATRKTIFEVDYSDFDEFVEGIYGGNFEFVADHEANNYSSYDFTAPNMNRDFGGEFEAKIRNGNFYNVPVHAIFNVLLKDGHIEEGEYIIKVSW